MNKSNQQSKLRRKNLQSIKQIQYFENTLLSNEQRQCTDILCTIIGVTFTLLMIIISFSIYNKDHYIQANFPTDTSGKLCGIDYPGYSFIYFVQAGEMKQRLCVTRCPLETDGKLLCKPTETRGCNFNNLQGFKVEYYATQSVQDRNGKFCYPIDQQIRNQFLVKSKLRQRDIYMNSYDSFKMCAWIGIILSVIYGFIVQFFPKLVNQWIPFLGAFMVFVLLICTFAYPTPHIGSKIIVGIIFIFFLILISMTIISFRYSIKYNGVLLKIATQFIKQHPLVLLNIPIFIGIFLLFQIIMVLQLNSVWTSANLQFDAQNSLYWQYKSGGASFMTFLLIVQAIWGFFFIKQCFNFIISGYLTLWYYKKHEANLFFPYKILLTKHIGSVIACAFMTGFFSIIDTIFDFIRFCIKDQNQSQIPCYLSLKKFLDLVRSQALVYVIFTGNAYCNSARYCEYLCYNGSYVKYGDNYNDNQQVSQSVSRTYRLSAYLVLGGFVSLLGLYLNGNISIYAMFIIILNSYFIINFIVQLHADAADSLMILYLSNQQFAARNRLQTGQKVDRLQFQTYDFQNFAKYHGATQRIIYELKKDTEQRQSKQCWNMWNF